MLIRVNCSMIKIDYLCPFNFVIRKTMMLRYGSKTLGILVLLIVFKACSSINIDHPEIRIDELSQHIAFLASDSLKGRFPGTPEDSIAAHYILSRFLDFGLHPLDSNGLQYFDVITSSMAGKNNTLYTGDLLAEMNKDFVPFSFSESATLTADVVFAGYGFQIEQDDLVWDDYKNVDVTGKWVLLLRGDPEVDTPTSPFMTFSGDRDKVMLAKDLGAGGVLFVSGISYDPNDQLVEIDTRQHSTGIPVFHITRSFADLILNPIGKKVADLEEELNRKRQPVSFAAHV